MHPTSNVRLSARLRFMPRVALVLALGAVLAGCGEDEPAPAAAPTATTATAPVATSAVAGMSAEQLREAASKAYSESRLYAPAGDNAVEYYLALREKAPGDPAASSALIDLLPMTVIATEQSINREDFGEALRLATLIEKTDSAHPSLARLKSSITAQQQAAAARAVQQQLTAEEQAKRQAELEQQRLADQKRQQELAARQLADRQATERQAAEQRAAEQRAAEQRAAEQRLAEQRAAEQRAAEQRQAAAPQAPSRPAAQTAAIELRPLSTPSPRFPEDAMRNGTSGEVQIEFTVGTDGSVTAARVIRATPPRVFDREALAAVRRWRFAPIDAPVTTRRSIAFQPGS